MAQETLYNITVEGLEKFYISKSGNVYRPDTTYIKPFNNKGYLEVSLCSKKYYIHRLMALTFIPIIDISKNIVNHIKTDNALENLEWVTQKENVNKSLIPTSHPRRVLQINTLTNEVIASFDSVTEAAHHIKLTRYAVSKACLCINKTAGDMNGSMKIRNISTNMISI